MTIQERFAQEWGMDIDRVTKLVRLAQECAIINDRKTGGDIHPRNPRRADQNLNRILWGQALAVATADLAPSPRPTASRALPTWACSLP